jgi:hypothetical protein
MSEQNEQEQIPVEVKLVDVSPEMKQGYRQVCVFMNEPPPVTFRYCFGVIGWWLLASACWAAIFGVAAFVVMVILSLFGVVR